MLQLFVNGSAYNMSKFVMNSDSITSYVNNKANTFSFRVIDTKINENSLLEFWEGSEVREQSNSGQPTIKLDDVFEDTEKYRVGDIIYVDFNGANEERKEILSIDTTNKNITFTTNLSNTHARGIQVGRKIFGGVVLKNPDQEFAYDGRFEYKISAVDYTKLFDKRNVNDTYVDQYPREILGRVIYEFCANDTEAQLFTFESAMTASGVATAMSNNTTDRIQGTNAQNAGASGAGTAVYSTTVSSTDLSSYDHARLWWKTALGNGAAISNLQLRLGSNSSNVYVYDAENVGSLFEDCWNYEAFDLPNPDSTVGSPNIAAVTYIEIRFDASSAISSGNLIFDELLVSTGGFTIQNVVRGLRKFSNFAVNQKKPTLVLDTLAKQLSSFWKIDYNRDIHYFSDITTESAPFALTDTSENYRELELEVDASHLKNSQVVRGTEAPAQSILIQEEITDGIKNQFTLHYKPSELSVYTENKTILDAMDSTTGWTGNADATLTANTSVFREGAGSINLTKTGTSASEVTLSKGLGGDRDMTNEYINIYIYVKDATTLAKITDFEILLFDGANLFYQSFPTSLARVGKLVRLRVKVSEMSTSGSPSITGIDTIRFDANTINSSQTWSAGDVIVDTFFATSFTERTVGVENLVDEASVDFVFSFQEKTVRNASYAVLPEGDIIRFDYYPYMPIRVQVTDPTSVAAMKLLTGGDGIYDGSPITDLSIRSFEEARQRANAEIDAYKNGVVTISFETDTDGLDAGQVIRITDSQRGIDDTYLIQQIKRKPEQGARATYSVQASTSLFGMIEFLQLLLKRSETDINQNEIVDILVALNEIVTLVDAYVLTQKDKVVTAGDLDIRKWDFTDLTGSVTGATATLTTDWVALITNEPSAVISIDLSTRHNNGRAIKVVTTVGGAGKDARLTNIKRFPIKPSTAYTLSVWAEFLAALTNNASGNTGGFISLVTYQNKIGGSALDSVPLWCAVNSSGFKKNSTTFTSDANANYMELNIGINAAIGTVSFADILLEETGTDTSTNPAYASFSQAT